MKINGDASKKYLVIFLSLKIPTTYPVRRKIALDWSIRICHINFVIYVDNNIVKLVFRFITMESAESELRWSLRCMRNFASALSVSKLFKNRKDVLIYNVPVAITSVIPAAKL
jgi:hypothetical protein